MIRLVVPLLCGLYIELPSHGQPPNLASPSSGAVVSGPQNASGSRGKPMVVNDGEVVDYGPSHGYAWAWLDEPLVLTFPEQTTINKVEALLLDVDARRYDFRLEAQVDGEWGTLDERKGAKGWVTLEFEPIECQAVRLVFAATTLATKSYHVVEVAAYNDPEPARDSPLKKAWLASRREREMAELGLLGVDEALKLVFFDEDMFRRSKELAQGERRWIDTDEDGDPDLIIFKDQNVLVVAIDDDDDATSEQPEPDEDSDCWVADVDLDGRPDRMLDYFDDDGDGDVDRAHHYYLHFGWFGSRPGLVLIWDYNDNNRTWTLDRYSYHQGKCQWKCDFGGDEGFSIFAHDGRSKTWEAHWECPFYFYDPDKDELAEVAVRLEGRGRSMRALRFSMNADNDVTEGQPYDYDFGIVALGPVELPEEWLVTTALRAGETGPYLPHATTREAVRKLPWSKTLLVWDENDSNVDPGDRTKHERWEGVINSRYGEFPQIGGPACGTVNKRYELDVDNSGGLKLYPSRIDGRLHLFGAEKGTLLADDDGDRRPDRIVEYRDTDGDGFFDRWMYDDDADGQPERTFDVSSSYVTAEDVIALEWRPVVDTYAPLLRQAVEGRRSVAQALGAPLTADPENGSLELLRWQLEGDVHAGLSSSIQAAREAGNGARAKELEQAREHLECGQYDKAVALIGNGAASGGP